MRRRMFAGLALTICTLSCARAADAPDFRGKTVTVLIAFEAGGPYDLYGRLLSRHLGAHLPGAPDVVARNMAGAGGLVGVNYLYNAAPRDGLTIGVLSQTVALSQALATTPGVKYDARDLSWVGRITSNVEVQHSLTRFGFTDFNFAREREIIVAGTGPTSSSVVFPRLLNETIGTKFKVVPGYQGPQSASLAMERGEVAAIVKPWSSIKATELEAVKRHDITLIMQYTRERHRELADVPAVVDVARNDGERRLFGFFASGGALGTSVAAPPGLTAAAVSTLRNAFVATLASPELREDAARSGLDVDPLDGAKTQEIVAQSFDVDAETLARARDFSRLIAE